MSRLIDTIAIQPHERCPLPVLSPYPDLDARPPVLGSGPDGMLTFGGFDPPEVLVLAWKGRLVEPGMHIALGLLCEVQHLRATLGGSAQTTFGAVWYQHIDRPLPDPAGDGLGPRCGWVVDARGNHVVGSSHEYISWPRQVAFWNFDAARHTTVVPALANPPTALPRELLSAWSLGVVLEHHEVATLRCWCNDT